MVTRGQGSWTVPDRTQVTAFCVFRWIVQKMPPIDEPTRTTWNRGPLISELERRRYEFEGGGAASQRQPRRTPGKLARLFRLLMRGR